MEVKSRRLSRALLALVLLISGALAAARVELAYLPTWTFPELEVDLALARAGDLEDLTRRYVVPLESTIRTLGSVRGQAGEAGPTGARLRVRFDPGIDPERKAARLESELQSLRRRLPEGATLSVSPVRQGGTGVSTILWLPYAEGKDAAGNETKSGGGVSNRLVRALEGLPEVQSVRVAGKRRLELRLNVPEVYGSNLSAELSAAGNWNRLGYASSGDRQIRVVEGVTQETGQPRFVRHRSAGLSLASMVERRARYQEAAFTARVGGKPGQILLLYREYDASPLIFANAVERVLKEQGAYEGAELLLDEAEPLLRLLRRAGLGLVSAAALLALLLGGQGGWRPAAAGFWIVPLAVSAVANAAWLSETSLDVTTVPVAMSAVASALLFQILRLRPGRLGTLIWIALSAACLPVAVALVGGPVGAFLAAPVRFFALAVPLACAATLLVPSPPSTRSPWARRALRFALRNPWAVLLGSLSAGYFLLTVWGEALTPRPGRLTAPVADISLSLRFAQGSTVEDAEAEVARVERYLDGRDEVIDTWSVIFPQSATVGLKLRDEDRSWIQMQALSARLETALSHIGASLSAQPLAGFGGTKPVQFDDEMGEKPHLDEELTEYRFILRSTDLPSLEVAYARVLEKIEVLWWRPTSEMIQPEWGKPSARVELVPRPGVDSAQLSHAIESIRRRATQGPIQSVARLPGTDREVVVRTVSADTPDDERDVPSRQDLSRARWANDGELSISPLEMFDIREGETAPTIDRETGSFVLPVTVRFMYLALGQRPGARDSLHFAIRSARLPPGVSLERPELDPGHWTPERRRLLAIGSALPLLFLGLLICRLGSIPLGFAALSPSISAIALLAPGAELLKGHMDEMMLLALLTGLAAALPVAAEVAAAVRIEKRSTLAAGQGYRRLLPELPTALIVVCSWAVLFGLPAAGLDALRFPWAPSFWVAAIVGPTAVLCSFLVLPVLLRSIDLIRLRDKQEAARLASPLAWQDDSAPVNLSVQNLCKVYSNGFVALRSMEFHLEPGIIGLLGPNGAGKTTLLRTLCGLLEPSRGRVLFQGEPVLPENRAKYRRLVGFLPQSFNAYESITVAEFLDYWALEIGLNDTPGRRMEIERVLDQVGLSDCAGKKVRQLSGGMRRRIGIARALLGSPPILIVDEPTTGLDVESRNRLRESLLSVAGKRIIIFSTHIASDVAAAASRILMINQGRLLFDGSAGDLIQQAEGRIFECLVKDEELREFSKHYRVTTRVRTLDGIRVRAVAGLGQKPAGEIVLPNLEEAYLAKLDLAPQGIKGRREHSLLDLGAH